MRQPEFVIEALTGVSVGKMPARPAPNRTSSPSMRAIAMAEALDPRLGVQDRIREVRKLFDNNPKQPGEQLDLVPEADAIWLRNHYLRDLENMRASGRISLLQPPHLGTA